MVDLVGEAALPPQITPTDVRSLTGEMRFQVGDPGLDLVITS
jgi:hypothetical protein